MKIYIVSTVEPAYLHGTINTIVKAFRTYEDAKKFADTELADEWTEIEECEVI
jgi:hypothetical protein